MPIYNIAGQLVKTVDQGNKAAGYHQVQWNCRDEKGDKVSAGVYIYRLEAGEYAATQKLVVIR
ncbi:T9SS type A sorting domain-containing protein [candidate division TA06 bacterium]|uniref:T9SS type A sorting domain-containing protein n=1 Tax=candidate division TA06 bacterium TaxID=2250710 RepID=A0A933IBS3_UNCT6|nr:T9SS type A sorting domain-containing protein [candidate division TA06 bacterium]